MTVGKDCAITGTGTRGRNGNKKDGGNDVFLRQMIGFSGSGLSQNCSHAEGAVDKGIRIRVFARRLY